MSQVKTSVNLRRMTLREIIAEHGATKVASDLGFTREYMSQILHRHRAPSRAVLVMAERVYGADIDIRGTVVEAGAARAACG